MSIFLDNSHVPPRLLHEDRWTFSSTGLSRLDHFTESYLPQLGRHRGIKGIFTYTVGFVTTFRCLRWRRMDRLQKERVIGTYGVVPTSRERRVKTGMYMIRTTDVPWSTSGGEGHRGGEGGPESNWKGLREGRGRGRGRGLYRGRVVKRQNINELNVDKLYVERVI